MLLANTLQDAVLYGTEAVNDINDVSFSLDLYNTLIPEVALGSNVPTFTRASAATITDCYGRIWNCKSGEARFEGARRVENLFTSSATLSTQTLTTLATTYTVSFTGSGTITFSGTYSGSLVGSDGVRKAITFTTTAGSLVCTVSGSVTLAQCEEGSLPSEYVSNGTLSAPYHGCNVDGVKYFKTYNGNTVSNNVVTEAVGAPIPNSILKGYLVEGSRTNLLTYSEDFSNAVWNKSNITVTTNAINAPNGTLTADKVEATATASTNPTRSLILTSATMTYSIYVKKGSGATDMNVFGFYNWTTGLNVSFCSINYDTGVLSGAGVNASVTALPDGWFRIAVNPTTGLNSGDTVSIYWGNAGSGLTAGTYSYFWGAQLEQSSFASSYIPTTTAAVTRAMDDLRYFTANNVLSARGTAYAEVQASWNYTSIPTNPRILDVGGNGSVLVVMSTHGTPYFYNIGDTITAASGLATFDNLTNKHIASKWSDLEARLVYNGNIHQINLAQVLLVATYMHIGNYSQAAGYTWYGNIKKIRIWTKALTDETLKSITK